MQRAFQAVSAHPFYFGSLNPPDEHIEDIQDPFVLTRLLEETRELQTRNLILTTLRVRVEAFLNRKPGLRECLDWYCILPENSEAERLVAFHIVKLLREKVAESSDFKSVYAVFSEESTDLKFFHETLMRLIGEKFFPKKG